MNFADCSRHLAGFFETFGVEKVLDVSLGRDIALKEICDEFLLRKRENNTPLLTSACPGWVCYAEKTHGKILPKISNIKSPQQIMGNYVKDFLYKDKNVYHVTIMPCFDKKLEASREDFFSKKRNNRDVDCVLTSLEVDEMLKKEGKRLNEYEKVIFENEFISHEGGGSGGYLHHILMNAANKLYNLSKENFQYTAGRNKDMTEISVMSLDGQVVLKGAKAYGFRNIQNIVQKLKRNKCPYDVVEIMACPGGCLNGGGQIRNNNLEEVGKKYEEVTTISPESSISAKNFIEIWIKEPEVKENALKTSYHPIEKDSNALTIKW